MLLHAGVSMSFTAFPVLASLLTTMGLLHAPVGTRVSNKQADRLKIS
jgi:hypothetical protein